MTKEYDSEARREGKLQTEIENLVAMGVKLDLVDEPRLRSYAIDLGIKVDKLDARGLVVAVTSKTIEIRKEPGAPEHLSCDTCHGVSRGTLEICPFCGESEEAEEPEAGEVALLPAEQKARLVELEAVVSWGVETFIEVGLALAEIRESKLYREDHGTFESYCRERWGFTDRRARQLIQAADVVGQIERTGTRVPVLSERHARVLGPLVESRGAEAAAKLLEDVSAAGPPTVVELHEAVEKADAKAGLERRKRKANLSAIEKRIAEAAKHAGIVRRILHGIDADDLYVVGSAKTGATLPRVFDDLHGEIARLRRTTCTPGPGAPKKLDDVRADVAKQKPAHDAKTINPKRTRTTKAKLAKRKPTSKKSNSKLPEVVNETKSPTPGLSKTVRRGIEALAAVLSEQDALAAELEKLDHEIDEIAAKYGDDEAGLDTDVAYTKACKRQEEICNLRVKLPARTVRAAQSIVDAAKEPASELPSIVRGKIDEVAALLAERDSLKREKEEAQSERSDIREEYEDDREGLAEDDRYYELSERLDEIQQALGSPNGMRVFVTTARALVDAAKAQEKTP
jgi:hypothetical protein